MLVDTDVLIWHLRGYPNATRRLDELASLTLSAVSYLEVLQGMRNKEELTAVQKMLQRRQATLLPLTDAITQRAIADGIADLEPRPADERCAHRRYCARTACPCSRSMSSTSPPCRPC